MNSTHREILGQLESRTEAFRCGRADEHRSSAAAARRAYTAAVDAWCASLAGDLGARAPRPRASEAAQLDLQELADRVAAAGKRRPTTSRERMALAVAEAAREIDKYAQLRASRVERVTGVRPEVKPSPAIMKAAALAPPPAPLEVDDAALLRAAVGSQRWHDQRARGQEARFSKLAHCGARLRVARCGWCSEDGKQVPDGCGVGRLCGRCAILQAKRRRARFGRARGRVIAEAKRHGLTRQHRRGGRYTEKMLTLTVPHVTTEGLEARARELAGHACSPERSWKERKRAEARRKAAASLAALGTVRARVELLWRAWPRFRRALVAHLELRAEHTWTKLHRAFEWTPGGDALGHPHFHLWMWCPYLDARALAAMWTEAILDAGGEVPRTADGMARLQIQVFRTFDGNAAEELLKGGRREALTLSRLYHGAPDEKPHTTGRAHPRGHGPESAFDYADGWTLADVFASSASPDTIAALYEVLEGKRLTQASAGFFGADEPATCPCCTGRGQFSVRFMFRNELLGRVVTIEKEGTGPP